jgi:hypothetical protein
VATRLSAGRRGKLAADGAATSGRGIVGPSGRDINRAFGIGAGTGTGLRVTVDRNP